MTIIFATIYGSFQQVLRQSAYDPQTQMAEDVASQLNTGATPTALLGNQVNMASSLAPFIIIYHKDGSVVAGSGILNGMVPTIPYGVLQYTKLGQDHGVTWQPQNNVRIASVTVAANDYYVVGGRSMRLVEQRIERIGLMVLLGWLASLGVLSLTYVLKTRR